MTSEMLGGRSRRSGSLSGRCWRRGLEFHRTTLLLKCEGLNDVDRKRRPVPTSLLSLHGLVRHMGEVERNWFRRVLAPEPDAPPVSYDREIEDSELVPSTTPTGTPTWRSGTPSARSRGGLQRRVTSATPACGAASLARCGGST